MQRTFNHTSRGILALLLGAGAVVGQEVPAVAVPKLDLTLEGIQGMTYQVQRSTDLKNWITEPTVHFGVDGLLEMPSVLTPGSAGEFVRILAKDRPAIGLAPWSMTGVTLDLMEGSMVRRLEFISPTQVNIGGASRSYLLQRTDLNQLEVAIEMPGGSINLALGYQAQGIGTVVRRDMENASSVPVESLRGTFVHVEGIAGTDDAPVTVHHAKFVFLDGGSPEAVVLNGDASGTETDAGAVTPIAFIYTPTAVKTASLVVQKSTADSDVYVLEFVSQTSGLFRRTQIRSGSTDEDKGVFSFKAP